MAKQSRKAVKKRKATTQQTVDPSRTLDAAPRLAGRVLNVLRDATDLRDRIYEPALLDLRLSMDAPDPTLSPILDQGQEGACTGFALSSAITLMNRIRYRRLTPPQTPALVSTRMLYEMAKLNDEWPGQDYEGSSIRGALKGFYNNGVCREELAPYRSGETGWFLNKVHARDARNIGLGAYYRLRPQIIDYHAALNEVGVIYVSATVHSGWRNPPSGDIRPSHNVEGGHAFIIVGYDDKGFLIQNSWGEDWGGFNGAPGIARWRYEDWSANVMDAWVFRLSVPTPDSFDVSITQPTSESANLFAPDITQDPRHCDIIGHLIHLNDGQLVERGKYPTPMSTIQETADFLADETATAKRNYKHLLIYAHGGLNDETDSANRVLKMKEVFKRNGIYPIHFMWETGLFETLKDVIFSSHKKAEARVGGVSDFFDRVLESFARGPGTAIWRDMKWDAEQSFKDAGGGRQALKAILEGNASRTNPLDVHLVGHSAGAILLAHLLNAMGDINPLNNPIKSCSLMAPACTVNLYQQAYHPKIGIEDAGNGITKLSQYNLTDEQERDDTVTIYRKSLLYFVSNAFEDRRRMPLLGMEAFADQLTLKSAHKIFYPGRRPSVTESKTHGGFDNDRKTMNDILKTVLGKRPSPSKSFQHDELRGY